jgi:hypothetical protein
MNLQSYERARRSLRVRRLGFFAVFGLLLLFPYAARWSAAQELEAGFGVAVAAWLLACGVLMLRWFMFRCPRCQQPFFQKPGHNPRVRRRNYYTSTCGNCGLVLKKNSPDQPLP